MTLNYLRNMEFNINLRHLIIICAIFTGYINLAYAQNWACVSCGYNYTLAVSTDGSLWAWGNNAYGELGLGYSGNDVVMPTRVGTANNWATVSCGGNYFVSAIKKDGTLWTWGYDDGGQLGLGTGIDAYTPTQVGSLTGWTSVSCGEYYTVAICSGSLWAWGDNTSGQLGVGVGDNTSRNVPTRVATHINNWSTVACGDYHTLAISSMTLWAWGDNTDRQLGVTYTDEADTPVPVGLGFGCSSVSAGVSFSMAISTSATLWAWGYNEQGELGLGYTSPSNTPAQVYPGTIWSRVSCGEDHAVGVQTSGMLYTWGDNSDGQLGLDNTSSGYTSPNRVGALSNWAYPSGGWYYSAAISTNGVLYSWGSNSSGQLGVGDENDRYVPTQALQPGIISGIVTKSSDSSPLSGALVQASFYSSGVMISSSITNASGAYSITISSGIYNLNASIAGYNSQTQTGLTISPGLTTTVNFSLAVQTSTTTTVVTQSTTTVVAQSTYTVTTTINNTSDTNITVPFANGNSQIYIPAGTFSTNVILTVSTSSIPSALTQSTFKITSVAVDISNDQSLQPLKYITITLYYSASDVVGMNVNNLIVGRYDTATSKWVPLQSTVYPDQRKIVAQTNHLCVFAVAELGSAQIAADVKNAYCFPSPVRFSAGDKLFFAKFSPNAVVYIVSTAGQVLKKFAADANGAIPAWDGMTDSGDKMASGVYIVHAKDDNGNKKIFEIMTLK